MSSDVRPRQGSSLLGIQYLRGIAAVMVVFHHALHFVAPQDLTGFGATGVDIFFVISGFIMAYSISRSLPEGGAATTTVSSRAGAAADFWLKRIIRVAPLYWVALAIAWRTEIMHGDIHLDLIKDYFFVPRFYSLEDMHIWPKLIPGWTINCEMFFYLIFGAAILVTKHTLRFTLAIIVGLSTMGFFLEPESAPWKLYTWSVFLEFGLGILLFSISRTRVPQGSAGLRAAVLILAATVLVYLARNSSYEYSELRFLAYGLPAALIVWTSLPVRQKRGLSFFKLLGDASYSIYLFHSTIGLRLGLRAIAALHLSADDWFSASAEFAIYLVISIAAGIAMHRFVERPLLDWMRRGESRITGQRMPVQ